METIQGMNLFKGWNCTGKYGTLVTFAMQSECVVAKLSKTSDMLYQNEEKRLFFPQYENGLNKDIGSSDKNREWSKKLPLTKENIMQGCLILFFEIDWLYNSHIEC